MSVSNWKLFLTLEVTVNTNNMLLIKTCCLPVDNERLFTHRQFYNLIFHVSFTSYMRFWKRLIKICCEMYGNCKFYGRWLNGSYLKKYTKWNFVLNTPNFAIFWGNKLALKVYFIHYLLSSSAVFNYVSDTIFHSIYNQHNRENLFVYCNISFIFKVKRWTSV